MMTKKFSDVFNSIRYATVTESEAVKRTQTNLKNIEAAKTGFADSKDDEFHQKRAERLKKAHNEYVKNNPDSFFKRMEEVEYTQEQIEEAMDHVITARQIIGNSKDKASGSHEYMKFLKTIRDKFGKEYSTNVHRTASKLAREEVEYIDEDCWKGYKAVGTKKKSGRDVPNCVPVSEAFHPLASNKTHEGSFQEKDYGKHFTYKKTNDSYAKKHNLPHEIDVHDGVRYGHVKGTVAHVATDENDDGTPKMQKWKLKKHQRWMKESRMADIVREAYAKSKKSKKDEMIDKDTPGKVEKFEANPQLADTLQKQ